MTLLAEETQTAWRAPGGVLLVSCYELGHAPHGVALPLAFLEAAGFAPDAIDVAVDRLDAEKIARARIVGISVPMHTALRLGVRVAERVREINPTARLVFYGLYAGLNAAHLLDHSADYCISGECETPLVRLIEALEAGREPNAPGIIRRGTRPSPHLERLPFVTPSRTALPALGGYARLEHDGESRVVGYTEASRGCKHLCTHCPIPPVYAGRFFAIPAAIVLADVRTQVAAGAAHLTFGDPDFLNGPTHALRIARTLHAEHPHLTFDCTVKVEHLLAHRELLPDLAACGCLFIITAVESLSDRVLALLEKGHTRADVEQALRLTRRAGIALRPTWVAFTPWTTRADYAEVLHFIAGEGLIDHVDPVQYAVRLLIPPGSLLLQREEMRAHLGELDEERFTYRWAHPDPAMDRLHTEVTALVEADAAAAVDPWRTFHRVRALALGGDPSAVTEATPADRRRAPRLSEPWFC